jgi:hypothetical protein
MCNSTHCWNPLANRKCQGLPAWWVSKWQATKGKYVLFNCHLPVMLTCVKFSGNCLSPFRNKIRHSLLLSQHLYLLLLPSYQICWIRVNFFTTKQNPIQLMSTLSIAATTQLQHKPRTDWIDRPTRRSTRMAAVLPHKPGHSFYPLLSHWLHTAANQLLISSWHHFESRFPPFSS